MERLSHCHSLVGQLFADSPIRHCPMPSAAKTAPKGTGCDEHFNMTRPAGVVAKFSKSPREATPVPAVETPARFSSYQGKLSPLTRQETPEKAARRRIDAALDTAGWQVQDVGGANIHGGRGVAIRGFRLNPGHGSDYLLYVDGKAAGVIEAKKEGETLTGVEAQAEKYAAGLPAGLPAPLLPLPFLYQSTGIETRFTNSLDPRPRSRQLFHFHKPDTLAGWLAEPGPQRPETLRARLRSMPSLDHKGLWPAQFTAVTNLEHSLAEDRPRALIQMATGSGKTFTAVTSTYRLVKFGNARRVLFLVDRANLGRQALKEFQQYSTPDDGRKFTELYNVQHLKSNKIDPVARVVITTIQRLYSMLQGEPDLDPEVEEGSLFDSGAALIREPVPVAYNPAIPVEFFDVVFIDECHRSIYTLWRQVLDYYDAYLMASPPPLRSRPSGSSSRTW